MPAPNQSAVPTHSKWPERIFLIVAVVAVVLTFFIARYAGVKEGRRQAREKIEQTTNLTAGPESLIQ